ncbi:MAG: hypothetical protein N3A63_03815 [Bacteroidetes bacterium]|nr:hypothetical protein [Bacteroidota bacterium]
MEILIGVLVVCGILLFLFEYRVRRPEVIVLYETDGKIGIRKASFYPRHFSLPIKRTTQPIQLTVEATAAGNLGVRVKILGSVAPSLEYIHALIRVGGWNTDAVARAAEEVQVLLQGLIKEYTERTEISALSSQGLLEYLNSKSGITKEKFGVELISLVVQSLEPTDSQIAEALRQQEQARILEKTEKLNNEARTAAAKAKLKADEEIAEMEHAVALKKAELKAKELEKESEIAKRQLQDELERNRMRLAFEREELELLKSSPELLMLTPQAARLAEASQSLKNARTVISLTPQELSRGAELLGMFQTLLAKALEGKANQQKEMNK